MAGENSAVIVISAVLSVAAVPGNVKGFISNGPPFFAGAAMMYASLSNKFSTRSPGLE